jgi:Ca2+-binding EF-hand superfamily protein
MTDEEINELIAQANKDGDNEMSFEEFYDLLVKFEKEQFKKVNKKE